MKAWFGPKFNGMGPTPRSWEGWVVTSLFLVGLFGIVRFGAQLHLTTLPYVGAGLAWIAAYLVLIGLTYRRDA